MKDFIIEHGPEICITIITIIVLCVFLLIPPYFEAKNFNKCTGGNATYSDALFNELRIVDCK